MQFKRVKHYFVRTLHHVSFLRTLSCTSKLINQSFLFLVQPRNEHALNFICFQFDDINFLWIIPTMDDRHVFCCRLNPLSLQFEEELIHTVFFRYRNVYFVLRNYWVNIRTIFLLIKLIAKQNLIIQKKYTSQQEFSSNAYFVTRIYTGNYATK